MPKHWIAAAVVVVLVVVGVVAYAVASDDGDSVSTVTAPSSDQPEPSPSTTDESPDSSTSTGGSSPFAPGDSGPTTSTESPASSAPGSEPPTDGSAASTSTTRPCPPPQGSTDPVDLGLGDDIALVSDVSVGPLDSCTDAVEFGFATTAELVPGVRASYQQPPFSEDGSGEPVVVAGDAFVEVVFEPASDYDFLTGELTYTGPDAIPGAQTRFVREARLAGAFEGTVRWIIGLEEMRPFAVEAVEGRVTVTFH